MGFPFDSLASPLTNRLWSAFFRGLDDVEGHQTCREVLLRIDNEKRNFEQLAAKREIKSPAHEKAITQDSFEKVDKAMADLLQLSPIRYWRIRRIAAEVSRLCKNQLSRPAKERDAAEIVVLINELVPRLYRRTRRMKVKDVEAPPF